MNWTGSLMSSSEFGLVIKYPFEQKNTVLESFYKVSSPSLMIIIPLNPKP
jgi:hypothetical protein